ncbi:hypothetical protein Hdeb2414_s0645g00929211 [Helianthus debilis subsp. tardiflorus]
MEDVKIIGLDNLATPLYFVVALAVNGSKEKNKILLNGHWISLFQRVCCSDCSSFDRKSPEFRHQVMGLVPVSQVREDLVIAYRKEVECETYEKLLPFKNLCATRKFWNINELVGKSPLILIISVKRVIKEVAKGAGAMV